MTKTTTAMMMMKTRITTVATGENEKRTTTWTEAKVFRPVFNWALNFVFSAEKLIHDLQKLSAYTFSACFGCDENTKTWTLKLNRFKRSFGKLSERWNTRCGYWRIRFAQNEKPMFNIELVFVWRTLRSCENPWIIIFLHYISKLERPFELSNSRTRSQQEHGDLISFITLKCVEPANLLESMSHFLKTDLRAYVSFEPQLKWLIVKKNQTHHSIITIGQVLMKWPTSCH